MSEEHQAFAALCERAGIAPTWYGIDGQNNQVPFATLASLAGAFGLDENADEADAQTIETELARSDVSLCYVPPSLVDGRAWGVACQLGSLRSPRNCGMGDFADLAQLAAIIGAEGGDFIGLNPLHALFWSNPHHSSPFSPSNRGALNPLYIAVDRVHGFDGFTADELAEAERLRQAQTVDLGAVHTLKDGVLRRAFAASGGSMPDEFLDDATLVGHACFEALSGHLHAEGEGAGWMGWPQELQDAKSNAVAALVGPDGSLAGEVRYHLWLQHTAQEQLAEARQSARDAGMRIGLYLDLAVGVAADGSATWSDPALTVPGVKVGAPPDPFSDEGQDWGLAPLSPTLLAEKEGVPFGRLMGAVMAHGGAIRIDHAMALARLFVIPLTSHAMDGAYVRYPLEDMLDALAEASNRNECLVIGEDLGVVPEGFRPIMERRRMHAYKVFYFERDDAEFRDPANWSRNALACVGTHDTATFAGWWSGHDIEVRRSIGQFDDDSAHNAHEERERDRNALRRAIGWNEHVDWNGEDIRLLSTIVHRRIADAPCRLAVVQLDDALCLRDQPNMPGTTDEHPNWRRKLPVDLDGLRADGNFAAHAQTMRNARPR